jgi:WD40 repeat protein
VAGYADGLLRVFDLVAVELEAKLSPLACACLAVAFSCDGRVILSAGASGEVAVSSSSTGRRLRLLRDHVGSELSLLDTARAAGQLARVGSEVWLACGRDQRISVWTADWSRDFNQLLDWISLPRHKAGLAPETVSSVESAAGAVEVTPVARFAPGFGGDVIVIAVGDARPRVLCYSLRQQAVVQSVTLPRPAMTMALAPGLDVLVFGSADRLLTVVELQTGSFQDYLSHGSAVAHVAIVDGGRTVLSVGHHACFAWLAANVQVMQHPAPSQH